MKELTLVKTGRWMAGLTLLIGGALDIHYLVTREVEAGTFAYFFLVFAGIINSFVLIPLIILAIVSKANGQRLMVAALFLLAAYLVLAFATYYMFRIS